MPICAHTRVQVFCKRKAVALAVLNKAKAVALQQNVAKFAATALGQIINADDWSQGSIFCKPLLVLLSACY